jgi:putative transposase
VDTLGLLLTVVAHSASVPDCHGAKLVCMRLLGLRRRGLLPRLRLLWADSAYRGRLIAWVAAFAGWVLEIVKRTDAQEQARGFAVQPHRWIVERTFGWLVKFRRLVRDYEETQASSEAWVRLAMIHVMVRRLAHGP